MDSSRWRTRAVSTHEGQKARPAAGRLNPGGNGLGSDPDLEPDQIEQLAHDTGWLDRTARLVSTALLCW